MDCNEAQKDMFPNPVNQDVPLRAYVKPEIRVLGAACEHTLGGPAGGGEPSNEFPDDPS